MSNSKRFPPNERAQVAKFVVENHYSWIRQSFKEAMADVEAGRFVDLHTALEGNLVVTVDIGSDDIYRA